MSNNIYNILNSFNKLTPKDEPKQEAATIYESVDPRGSVKEGLTKVESNLTEKYMGFKAVEKAAKKGGAENPAAVAASIGREKYGKKAFQKAAAAGHKMHEGNYQVDKPFDYEKNPHAYGNPNGVMNRIRAQNGTPVASNSPEERAELRRREQSMHEEEMTEVAPPGMEDMVLKLKKQYPGHPEKAFATAWSIYNKKHGKTESMEEAAGPNPAKLAKAFAAYAKETFELGQEIEAEDGRESAESYYNDTLRFLEVARGFKEGLDDGLHYYHDLDTEAKEGACEFVLQNTGIDLANLGEGLEEAAKPDFLDVDGDGNKKETWKKAEKDKAGYKHKGTAYGGQAQKDEPEDDEDDDTPKTKGRPKKADSEKSQASLPWGGKPPKASDYKLPKHQGSTRTHSMSDEPPKGSPERAEWEAKQARKEKRAPKKVKESSLAERFNALLEGRMIDESGETLDHILNRFKHEVKQFEAGHDLDRDLYEALFDYYFDNGEMPYGTAKARTGDPFSWVTERLDQHLINTGKEKWQPEVAEAGIPGNLPPSKIPGKDALLKTPVSPWEKAKAVAKDTAKGMLGHQDVEHFGTGKQETGLEEELNELAKLAGLQVADEGNEFSGKLAQAKAQHKDSFEVDGKEYPVKESTTTLEDIAKLSGIAIEGRDYGDTKIEELPVYDNTPDEEIESVEVLTKGGDGEVAGKEKAMHGDRPTFKNADNPITKPTEEVEESFDPLSSLSDRLRSAYESIKIQK